MTYEIKIRQSVATCLQRYKSRTIGCEAHALVSEVSVFVSADGHVRGPTHAQKVRPTAGNGPTDLAALLGVSDVETIRRLNDAVLRAVRSRSTSSVRWRTSDDIIGKIISVRPAHEKGLAVIAVTDLDAPSGTISIALLMDIFELTRAEAEIAASLFCKSDLADIARERGPEWAEVARKRGSELADVALDRGSDWADVARERAPELADVARDRAADIADNARTQIDQRRRRWRS